MTRRTSKSLTAPTEKRICLRWAVLVFAAVASLLLAAACAPTQKTSQSGSATLVTTLPNDIANKAYADSILKCETPSGNCPEAIGLLVSKFPGASETQVFQCTSFLVANDIVATNSHCIPDDLRVSGSQCFGRVQVIFGQTAKTSLKKYDCDQVLSSTEIEDIAKENSTIRPDYAFIKLRSSVQKREPLKFSRLGLQDGLQLNVLAIDPDQDTNLVRGTLRLKKCITTQDTIAAQGFTHDFAPIGAAAGCHTIQGNSGSPMLDTSGKVRAILFGSGKDVKASGGIEMPTKFEDSTLLSNVACIAVPDRVILLEAINPACSMQTEANVFLSVLKKTPLKADSLFEAWQAQAPTMFQFDLAKTEKEGSLNLAYPNPTCLQPLNRWSQVPEKNTDGSVTIAFEVPVWSQTQALNTKRQAIINVKQTTTVKYQAILKIEALGKGQPTYMELSGQSPSGHISQSYKGYAEICN